MRTNAAARADATGRATDIFATVSSIAGEPAAIESTDGLSCAPQAACVRGDRLRSGDSALDTTRSTAKLALADVEVAPLEPGAVVNERYRIVRPLGEGAMGTVYVAEHVVTGRTVALKVLSAGWANTPEVARRFRAEARAASAIGHPNIVQVFDADELDDGRPYLVMELVRGRDLLSTLRRLGPLPWRRACRISARVCHALAAAHAVGIIHRDLKAENVMLDETADGDLVKVLDFGIAVNIADGSQRATLPGIAVGTPEYMSPEQARGDTPTATFDIYANGVLLFELLSGEPPFTSNNPLEILGRKTVAPAPSIGTRVQGLPDELIELVDASLAIDPRMRPSSAAALAEQLDRIASAASTNPKTLVLPQLQAPPSRAPWIAAALTLPVFVGALALLWPEDPPAPVRVARAREPDPAPAQPAAVPTIVPMPVVATAPAVVAAPPVEIEPPTPAPTPRATKRARTSLPSVASREPTAAAPTPSGPSPDDEACVRARREAEEARNAHDWRGVLRHTDTRRCWPSRKTVDKLRVKANMELSRFDECVSIGNQLDDPEVLKWVKLCEQRRQASG